MYATCTDGAQTKAMKHAGFTSIEMIVVLVLAGVMAVYALPKMIAAVSLRDDAWHDELQSALRFAQKSAVARRRLHCVTVNNTTVAVTTASAFAASTCTVALLAADGTSTFATADNSNATATVSPAGVMYFQPDGRVTSDGAGTTLSDRVITVSGASNIVVYGDTGYVQ